MSASPERPAAPSLPAAGPPPRTRPVVRRARRSGAYAALGAIALVGIVVGAGLGTHWFGLAPASHAPVRIAGAGASFLLSLLSAWQSAFAASTSYRVDYNPSGAGVGITDLADRTVHFAATDEPLSAAEAASLPGPALTLPITGGPVVLVYNLPGFSGTLRLSASQLVGIYSGTIGSWGDAGLTANNPGLAGNPAAIVPVVRLDAAGTSYVLTDYLSADNATWNASVGTSIQPAWPAVAAEVTAKGNTAMATYVAGKAGALGYVDLPDALVNHLPLVALENPRGEYVVPTVANTQSAIDDLAGQPIPAASGDWTNVSWVNAPGAGDYPLATLSYFLVLEETTLGYAPSAATATALVAWLRWAVTDGQSFAAGLDYDTPPPALLAQDLEALCTITYNAVPVETCP